jgi:cysteine-rich repeat protein
MDARTWVFSAVVGGSIGLLQVACSDDGTSAADATGSTDTTATTNENGSSNATSSAGETTGATTADTSGASDTGGSSGSTDSTGDGIPENCGDGVVDPDEECDDGNDRNADGCNVDCRISGQEIWRDLVNGDEYQDDEARGVTVDADGRVTAVGWIWKAGDRRDCLVHAYDPDGSLAWDDVYAGAATLWDYCEGVGADSAGAVVVSGAVTLADQTSDGLIRKLDRDGVLQWMETHDGPDSESDYLLEVAMTPDDDALVGGFQHTPTGGQDAWIARYSPAGGAPAWTDTWDFGSGDRAEGLDVAPDGTFAATGKEDTGGIDGWVLRKYDASGEESWTLRAPAEEPYSRGRGVAFGADGSIVLLGSILRVTSDPEGFVRAFSPDGEELWTYWHEHDQNNAPRAIEIDSVGDIVVTGQRNTDGSTEMWIDKLASDGTLLWQYVFPPLYEYGSSSGNDLAIDPRPGPAVRDQILVAGWATRSPDLKGFLVLRLTP